MTFCVNNQVDLTRALVFGEIEPILQSTWLVKKLSDILLCREFLSRPTPKELLFDFWGSIERRAQEIIQVAWCQLDDPALEKHDE